LNFKKLTQKTQGKGSLPCKSLLTLLLLQQNVAMQKRAKMKAKNKKGKSKRKKETNQPIWFRV
jgi:hypothetical protein